MSAKNDIPVSTLSKVEHNRLTMTYDKLLSLASDSESGCQNCSLPALSSRV